MRHQRFKLNAVLLITLGLNGAMAQESVITAGGDATGSSGFVSYTVGQIAYQTFSATGGSVACGVQQPYEITVVPVINWNRTIALSIRVYPNPATDHLSLYIDELGHQDLLYQLYDMQGRLLHSEKITCKREIIRMNNLVPSTYFVKVLQNNKEVKTFKIIKK